MDPLMHLQDVFRRTLSVKPGKEVHSSKLRRVLSGAHANDANAVHLLFP